MGSEITDRPSLESPRCFMKITCMATLLLALFQYPVNGEEIAPHPDAVPNSHAPGEVDNPENVKWIVADPKSLPGIVLDETDAILKGSWQYSTHTPPYVGIGYLHDQKSGKGEKSVTWKPTFPEAGWYEVRISHCYNVRRSQKALISIQHAKGKFQVRIDQQSLPEHGRLFRTLGKFYFEKGQSGIVEISNEGSEANKVVIADAVQFLRLDQALRD